MSLLFWRRPITITVDPRTRTWTWKCGRKTNTGTLTSHMTPSNYEIRAAYDALTTLGPRPIVIKHSYRELDLIKRYGSTAIPRTTSAYRSRFYALISHKNVKVINACPAPKLTRAERTTIATDGSTNHVLGVSAWSWWVNRDSYSAGVISGPAGSSTAELEAIAQAILAHPGPLTIVSDCKNVVTALTRIQSENVLPPLRRKANSEVDREIYLRIATAIAQRDIEFVWTPAHKKVNSAIRAINNEADLLARFTMRAAV